MGEGLECFRLHRKAQFSVWRPSVKDTPGLKQKPSQGETHADSGMFFQVESLLSAVSVLHNGWLDFTQPVCVSWLLSTVRLLPLDWTRVAFAVKGHSTWVDILPLTSAMNLAEPSYSKAPLWNRQQPRDCFLLRHMHTLAHTKCTHSYSFEYFHGRYRVFLASLTYIHTEL